MTLQSLQQPSEVMSFFRCIVLSRNRRPFKGDAPSCFLNIVMTCLHEFCQIPAFVDRKQSRTLLIGGFVQTYCQSNLQPFVGKAAYLRHESNCADGDMARSDAQASYHPANGYECVV